MRHLVTIILIAILFLPTTVFADGGPFDSTVNEYFIPNMGNPHDITSGDGDYIEDVNLNDGTVDVVIAKSKFDAIVAASFSRDSFIKEIHDSVNSQRENLIVNEDS